ncbi:FAD-dependent oxidoreductase [[Mycobacterium] nativiensis]|uniref:FAD-dependent oxidoreductase n=1 Tax=[Mycobacterium] nativiensis TaxID=2855503 RepID=A0ABU5XVX0_9MYCO|nr:FAD-dependent oxidoreductase [Mycolicibacter sp. MYC340]MEB3032068.1 FAD-dependent oxidoreductase [Mycolicibacter sp. MYC340]
MDVYKTQLMRRELVAEDTMAFYFARPAGYEFLPGQSFQLTLIDPPNTDAKGPTREFTIASAPHEDELMVAMRMRDSAFKEALRDAPLGATVQISEADGDLILHSDPARPAVLIAGGIGVTPFLSIARHVAREALQHPLYLFYSNWRPELAAFLPELEALQQANPHFRLIATMTEPDRQSWSGQIGVVDADLLRRHLPDLTRPVYYVAGPPPMALAMLDLLEDLGVDDADIKSAEFYGY